MAFNRLIECSIGKPNEIGTLIKDLRITFEVSKTLEKSSSWGGTSTRTSLAYPTQIVHLSSVPQSSNYSRL